MHHHPTPVLLALCFGICAAGVRAATSDPAGGPIAAIAAASSHAAVAAALLQPHRSAQPLPDLRFVDARGTAKRLSDFRGRVVLLNLWATWCPPCREELPTLDRLQALLGGTGFEVVALSIDRGGLAAVTSYFDQFDVRALHVYVDSSARALSEVGGIALPTTLLIGRDGREIARHVGPAQWDRADIVRLLRNYIDAPHPRSPDRASSTTAISDPWRLASATSRVSRSR